MLVGLRQHAAEGHTVIVTTNSTELLYLASVVLVVGRGGCPVFFGRPNDLLRDLGVDTYAEMMVKLSTDPNKAAHVYRDGPASLKAVAAADDLEQSQSNNSSRTEISDSRGPLRSLTKDHLRLVRSETLTKRRKDICCKLQGLIGRQYALLASRGITSSAVDRTWWDQFRNLLIALAPLSIAACAGALAARVVDGSGVSTAPSSMSLSALVVLTILCVLSGQSLTYNDVVKETRDNQPRVPCRDTSGHGARRQMAGVCCRGSSPGWIDHCCVLCVLGQKAPEMDLP